MALSVKKCSSASVNRIQFKLGSKMYNDILIFDFLLYDLFNLSGVQLPNVRVSFKLFVIIHFSESHAKIFVLDESS